MSVRVEATLSVSECEDEAYIMWQSPVVKMMLQLLGRVTHDCYYTKIQYTDSLASH